MKKITVGVAVRIYTNENKLQYGIYKRYLDYLTMERIVPLLLTPENYRDLIKHCQAILLPGGGDLNPSLYGDAQNNIIFDDEIDSFEFDLIQMALKCNLAILGICRGLQTLNVFFKGSLNQNILNHADTTHFLKNLDSSIYPSTSIFTNSHHHQSIKNLASNFKPFLISEDGVIEGIIDKKRKILAVQYHPEINKDVVLLKYFKMMII